MVLPVLFSFHIFHLLLFLFYSRSLNREILIIGTSGRRISVVIWETQSWFKFQKSQKIMQSIWGFFPLMMILVKKIISTGNVWFAFSSFLISCILLQKQVPSFFWKNIFLSLILLYIYYSQHMKTEYESILGTSPDCW